MIKGLCLNGSWKIDEGETRQQEINKTPTENAVICDIIELLC